MTKTPSKSPTQNGKQEKKNKHHSQLAEDIKFGQSISLEFFRSNAWLILIIVIATVALIGLRYKTKTNRAEIKALTAQLEIAQSEKLKEKADYMSLIRETEMKRLVREKGLPLEFQEQPPFLLLDE